MKLDTYLNLDKLKIIKEENKNNAWRPILDTYSHDVLGCNNAVNHVSQNEYQSNCATGFKSAGAC